MSLSIRLVKRTLGYRAGSRGMVVAINEPSGFDQVADATTIMADGVRVYLLPDEYQVMA